MKTYGGKNSVEYSLFFVQLKIRENSGHALFTLPVEHFNINSFCAKQTLWKIRIL